MIFTYFGIILFLLVERVKFIKSKSPVMQAFITRQFVRSGIPYNCEMSRHPE